ncbi:hypothetical protein ACWGJV_03940 [Streptomyces tendae]
MSWSWEYAFGAEEAARTVPGAFLTGVEAKADELVRAAGRSTYTAGATKAPM